MKIIYFFLMNAFIFCYSMSGQGVSPACVPCTGSYDLTTYTSDGWTLATPTKQVSYGGCIYTVHYKTRTCSGPGYKDIRIDAITLNEPCNSQLTPTGKLSDCEWLKVTKNRISMIMSEFLRSNFMALNGDYRLLMPSCFAMYGNDLFSPLESPSVGCSEYCCRRDFKVYTDDCDIPRMRETHKEENGRCKPAVKLPVFVTEDSPLWGGVRNYVDTFVSDIASVRSYEGTSLGVEYYKTTPENDCGFVYDPQHHNCIPVCDINLFL